MAGLSGVEGPGKRIETTQQGDVPQKKSKTVALLVEIMPVNVTISMKLLGSSSYGCCYLTLYRGMEVVSKNFAVREMRSKTCGGQKTGSKRN